MWGISKLSTRKKPKRRHLKTIKFSWKPNYKFGNLRNLMSEDFSHELSTYMVYWEYKSGLICQTQTLRDVIENGS